MSVHMFLLKVEFMFLSLSHLVCIKIELNVFLDHLTKGFFPYLPSVKLSSGFVDISHLDWCICLSSKLSLGIFHMHCITWCACFTSRLSIGVFFHILPGEHVSPQS